jgi:hypothetical protein
MLKEIKTAKVELDLTINEKQTHAFIEKKVAQAKKRSNELVYQKS